MIVYVIFETSCIHRSEESRKGSAMRPDRKKDSVDSLDTWPFFGLISRPAGLLKAFRCVYSLSLSSLREAFI